MLPNKTNGIPNSGTDPFPLPESGALQARLELAYGKKWGKGLAAGGGMHCTSAANESAPKAGLPPSGLVVPLFQGQRWILRSAPDLMVGAVDLRA